MGPRQRDPCAVSGLGGTHQQQFDAATGLLAGLQARRKYPRIVEYQQIAVAQKPRKFVEARMLDRAAAPIEHQHAGVGPVRDWFLGNQRFGQVVIQIIEAHR